MSELYSRPLSYEAKKALIEFIAAYIESLIVAEVDEKAEIAKQKAIEALKTDIDILAFATTLAFPVLTPELIQEVIEGKRTAEMAAIEMVEITETARKIDRSHRPGGV